MEALHLEVLTYLFRAFKFTTGWWLPSSLGTMGYSFLSCGGITLKAPFYMVAPQIGASVGEVIPELVFILEVSALFVRPMVVVWPSYPFIWPACKFVTIPLFTEGSTTYGDNVFVRLKRVQHMELIVLVFLVLRWMAEVTWLVASLIQLESWATTFDSTSTAILVTSWGKRFFSWGM